MPEAVLLLGPGQAPTLDLEPPTGFGSQGPSLYSPALASSVLDLVASGLTLYQISQRNGFPAWQTLYGWKRLVPAFSEAYAQARMALADSKVAQGEQAVDAELDLRLDGKIASAGVQRATSISNYKRWLAGCLDRETYGDATQVNVSGSLGIELSAILPPRPQQPDREIT